MPTYELECEECEIGWDVRCSYTARSSQTCPECRVPATPLISGMRLIGITPSRPLEFKVSQQRFETNEEYRKFEAETPAHAVSKRDPEYKDLMYRLSDKREKNALKMGYRNLKHQQSEWKKQPV